MAPQAPLTASLEGSTATPAPASALSTTTGSNSTSDEVTNVLFLGSTGRLTAQKKTCWEM
jgi:hypothetical protein